MDTTDTGDIAAVLAELGNETRLAIFRLLVRAGDEGVTIGAIADRLKLAPSTLAFHLRGLVGVGLVSQKKVGRSVICRAELERLSRVLASLEAECCRDLDDTGPDEEEAA